MMWSVDDDVADDDNDRLMDGFEVKRMDLIIKFIRKSIA